MISCQTCGDPRQDRFCPNCGEKKFHAGSLTIGHITEETFEAFSHFDGRFFRSMRTLLTKPGLLSIKFCNGITVPYMRPFGFFLVVNLIFFLVPLQNPFSLPFYNYVHFEPFKTFGKTIPAARHKLIESKMTEKELATAFNEKIKASSKIFISLFIPFFALIFGLLFLGTKKQVGEHFVFATHVLTFLISLFLIQSILTFLLPFIFSMDKADALLALIDGIVFCIYLSFATKRFYVTQWWRAILSSIIVVFLLASAMHTYRIFLYYQVLHAI
jgi:uncharacterized protein DUF3667